MAAALTVTNGRACRGLHAWIARATSSLPVPVSPVTRTGDEAAPTSRMRARSSAITGLSPTSSSVPMGGPPGTGADTGARSVDEREATARSTTRRSSSASQGLVMYWKAPRFTASTAAPIEPWAVTRTTGRSDCSLRTRVSSSTPSMPAIRTSVSMASNLNRWQAASAASPVAAISQRQRFSLSASAKHRAMSGSSSTTRMSLSCMLAPRFAKCVPHLCLAQTPVHASPRVGEGGTKRHGLRPRRGTAHLTPPLPPVHASARRTCRVPVRDGWGHRASATASGPAGNRSCADASFAARQTTSATSEAVVTSAGVPNDAKMRCAKGA